jgi:hypothetical protein
MRCGSLKKVELPGNLKQLADITMQTPSESIYTTGGWWEFTEKEAVFHCVSCGSTHNFELEKIKAVTVIDVVKCRNHIKVGDWKGILPANIHLHEDKPCSECAIETEDSLPS